MSRRYDVVIVGAGIAGALAAWRLGKRGVEVLLLEAGPPSRGMHDRVDYLYRFKENPSFSANSPYPQNLAGEFPLSDKNAAGGWQYYVQVPQSAVANGPVAADPSIPHGEFNVVRPELAAGCQFRSDYLRLSGGSTWHWLGTSLRMAPSTLKLKSTYGPVIDDPHYGRSEASDWPLSYDELEPWYSLAERDIGVAGPKSGEDRFGEWRSQPYPMPEVPFSYMDKTIAAGVEGLTFTDPGYRAAAPFTGSGPSSSGYTVTARPQARNTTPGYGGRPQCKGSTSCVPLCPIQAKYDATQHLELARRMPNVTVREAAVASRVLLDDPDRTTPLVAGIEFIPYDPKTGAAMPKETAIGSYYVLASNAVENPKLLLSSPWGNTTVANSSGVVGLYLADHPDTHVDAILDVPAYPYRGPLSTSGMPDFRDGPFRAYRGAFGISVDNFVWSGPSDAATYVFGRYGALIAGQDVPIYGAELAHQVRNLVSRRATLACLNDSLPQREFWVKIPTDPGVPAEIRNQADRYRTSLGLWRPVVHYGVDEYARRGMAASIAACVNVFDHMLAEPKLQFKFGGTVDKQRTASYHGVSSYDEIADPSRPYDGFNIFVREGFSGAGHIMGTHRMGEDRSDSVTDKFQRCHDHPNLFLLGSGNWPSYGTVNPTLTIAALSEWAPENIYRLLNGEQPR